MRCSLPRASEISPGVTQSATVTPNAMATERWPFVQGPSLARSVRMSSALPGSSLSPAGATAGRYRQRKANSTSTTGTPTRHHWKKGISIPSSERMKPIPMTLGGVPTGVASPPTDAAYEIISISAAG